MDWLVTRVAPAAMSLKAGQSFDTLDVRLVQAELKRQGARIA